MIATNYRGIGASGGTAPVTIDEMARDAIALIRALGFEKIDLLEAVDDPRIEIVQNRAPMVEKN